MHAGLYCLAFLRHKHLHVYGSKCGASWDWMNRQYLVLRGIFMGLVETAGRAHCYSAPEEWDSWKSLCPAAIQTEPCWLSSEATWRHGERPADSWGTGGCHGNRGSSHVSLARPRGWTVELLPVRASASTGVQKSKGEKKPCLIISPAYFFFFFFLNSHLRSKPLMINEFTNLPLAGCSSFTLCKYAKSTAIRISPSVVWLSSVSRDQGHVIKLLTFKLKRELLSHTDWLLRMSQELYNGCILWVNVRSVDVHFVPRGNWITAESTWSKHGIMSW